MTIQTVFAPDNNAPKFDLDKPSQLTQLLTNKNFWIVVAILSALFMLIVGSVGWLIIIYVIFGILGFIYSILSTFIKALITESKYDKIPPYFQNTHDYFKRHLVQDHNFNVDYESVGILIDAQARRIAFTLDPKTRPQVLVCNFNDVQRWQAYSQGVETQNQYGATLSSMSKYYVSVYIRNPEQPRYDFFTTDSTDADQWVARLGALLN
ncbi:hypothetical protein [Psychrobacter sp. Sarcosine-3u-12]|uniref:hypothetical protein n=1 Tax=Psychrobacter sp. Sarcosine-3u-12 TaxID=2058325 RepID=UPI000C34B7E7|nr:hypothetical protein [Psychrobacter sp. Sarcosine-3u-12]PKG34154.1 hypothetical protein CXF65_14320 [Psychrobacter sp. Sarcosine-3u-12]